MNAKRLAAAVDNFRERLGSGMVACDIYGPDGLSLAAYNSVPEAVALFSDVTKRVTNALADSGFPPLGRYYLIELVGRKLVCVMHYREYQWGCLIDLEKTNMGMLISVALPRAIEDLRLAMEG